MGEIKVTVQTEKRLAAINNLSIAIRKVAEALASGTTVEITNNTFNGGDPALLIKTEEEITETKIEKT
ncbi:hypothetical protein ES703_90688 [subsurface metagenome]